MMEVLMSTDHNTIQNKSTTRKEPFNAFPKDEIYNCRMMYINTNILIYIPKEYYSNKS